MRMRLFSAVVFSLAFLAGSASAATHHTRHTNHARHTPSQELTASSIGEARPGVKADKSALIVKAEVLLDRQHYSPGVIDGHDGDNFHNALRAFQQAANLQGSGAIDDETWNALAGSDSEPLLTSYSISQADVAGPYESRIPAKLEQMAKLKGLSYKSPSEELAEKFHMSEEFLRELNPGGRFDRVGEKIMVANVEPMELRSGRDTVEAAVPKKRGDAPKVDTVVVDKAARNVRAYGKDGKLLGFYPATIGSTEKPAPTGTFAVKRVAWNPDYHYNPKFAWKHVKARRPLTIRPGPNNPVGLVWIDLTAPSYGIHGTPDPDKIGKTESHGCIRLTNWDALDLAAMVHRGTTVRFEDNDSPVVPMASEQPADQSSNNSH